MIREIKSYIINKWPLKFLMLLSTLSGIIITFAVMISILFEAIKFFEVTPIIDFLFGTKWNPQIATYPGQSLSSSSFGMLPVLSGTILIMLISMIIAVPFGILSAIYLTEYARPKVRSILKPILEILAGIPTVVYGYFAIIVIAPFLKIVFNNFNIDISSESALCAGIVMGIMIIPFILSISDDALNAVPSDLKDASLALGATKSETVINVTILYALPSIIGGFLLAISRAIGETMIVVMAAGLVAKLTFNPLESVTTATAQIVTLLVGDQEADSPKTLAAFALGLVLFVMTYLLNVIGLFVTNKFHKK